MRVSSFFGPFVTFEAEWKTTGGRCRNRTCGFHRVKVALYRGVNRPRAFFSGLPCVASPFRVFGIAAGSPPSRSEADLLRPHRPPYCLRACSLCNLTEKRSNVKLGSFGVKRSISGAQTNFQI